jgi:sugar lactone lactonase YvrE
MFHRANVLSLRTLCQFAACVLFCLSCVGYVFASGPVAPVLVPYTVTSLAGNTQSTAGGYAGDNVPGSAATLNGLNALAVDSVGNVYIADVSNALIREVNAQTGIIKIIAGVAPTSCVGVLQCKVVSACSDGVLAATNPTTSKIEGIAVDGYGNVFFADANDEGVWVIYRGGAQVAAFINLVNPASVTSAGGVLPGYVYHVAGLATFKAGGCTSTASKVDKVPALQAGFHSPGQLGLDAAGNIYVHDVGTNNVVRVINTQSTSQTFFGVSVSPGYVAAIVNCNATLTAGCPASNPAYPFTAPAGAADYSAGLTAMTVDQYGNVYQLNGSGTVVGNFAGVAYAGGSALANLLYIESGVTATPGNFYAVLDNPSGSIGSASQAQFAGGSTGITNLVNRSVSIAVDPFANIYAQDYSHGNIFRVDVNSMIATQVFGTHATTGTTAVPSFCFGQTSGTLTYDKDGDGCPATQAKLGTSATNAPGYATFDSVGNLYEADNANNLARKVSVNTQFPLTATGAKVVQTVQVHFDPSDLPITTGTTPFPTTSLKITTGSTDFAINTTPTCSNYTIQTIGSAKTALDKSLECYVAVTFSPATAGARAGILQATSVNGNVYNFALTGVGSGSQIVADGGTQTVLPATGLGKASPDAVAVSAGGTVYIADPINNHVVVLPAGGGAQTTVGTGLSNPEGVAVDAAGNVYISDTENNRILEVAATTGTQTVLTTNVRLPQGLAVDSIGNVYVADTGNARIVQINPWNKLGAVPLLAYTGAPTFVNPVAVAVDSAGNIYVADSGNSRGIVKIAAGGGDLFVPSGATSLPSPATVIGFGTAPINSPSGVAVDAAGDLYVSDNSANIVEELPAATGPGSEPFALNFTGMSSPSGVAIDENGNIYVADTGNKQVLEDNRSQLSVNYGTVSLYQTPGTAMLKLTNIGNLPLTPAVPLTAVSGTNPGDFAETDTCAASNFALGTLASGQHCNLVPSFAPTASATRTGTMSVQNGAVTIALSGTGQPPHASLSLAASAPGGLVANQTATVTITATQPNGVKNIPSGQITFSYTVNGVAGAAIPPVTLDATGAGSFQLPTLLLGRNYVINATYSGDSLDSQTVSSPLTFAVPGTPVTVTASSLTYVYGSAVPQIVGTVSGILPADQSTVKYTFSTTATSNSPVGSYPITVVFSGGNYQNYGFPSVYNADGKTPSIETETPAPLTVVVNNAAATYGAANLTYTYTATGAVNGDVPIATFIPTQSSILDVGTYTIVPTLSIPGKGSTYDKINNYTPKITPGTLTITKSTSAVSVVAALGTVLPTALTTAPINITVSQAQVGIYGTPTGAVTINDVFTPITPTGTDTPVNETPIVLPLTAGFATYTPTSQVVGTHVYSFTYSGDKNFQVSSALNPATLLVDVADYTLNSTLTPIQVMPGAAPGTIAATPGTATLSIVPILGYNQVVNLTCSSPSSYVTCTLSPAAITMDGKTTQTSTLGISTPATLPLNFTSEVRSSTSGYYLAFLPLGALAFLPFFMRGRRRLSKTVWMIVGLTVLSIGMNGCGSNLVQFYTQVPIGPQPVTVISTSGSLSRSFTLTVNIQ